uniref:OmpA family protein n=2 Tax=Hirondellea gigas TaxID=1518452 RepID=A0A6A7G126_9CRUS
MKMKYALPIALLVSSSAFAAHTDNDWYAGLRLGATDYTDYTNNGSEATSAIDADVGGGVFLGYNFTNWFALEGGYTYLGDLRASEHIEGSEHITNNALELVTKFTWQTTDNLDLFVKAGAFAYKTDSNSSDDDGFNATAGIGAEYFFNDNISTRFEYQYYNNLALNDVKWDTHLLAVSVIYSWGAPKVIAPVVAPVVVAPIVEEKIEKVKEKLMQVDSAKVEVSFPFNSSILSEESMQQLMPIIEHLKAYPESKLILIGHTDSLGSSAYNQVFSEKRAEVLASYLSNTYSIDKSRMSISGEGERMPIYTNATKEGRALNRSVSVFSPSFQMEINN